MLAGIAVLLGSPLVAQTPSPQQVQQALQQPGLADQLRRRIAESGLTPDQIRARLRASGYPESLLDAYLGATPAGPAGAPGVAELAAIEALGLAPIIEQQRLPVDTGLIRTRGDTFPPSDVFGVDVFRRTTTQFLPLLSGPVPSDYKLGPGDVLVLILTGDVELSYTLEVTREGFVLIPQVGQVHVASLTLAQLRNVLYTRLGRVYSGVRRSARASTQFDITVAKVRANQVYVVGEVTQPGAYQISSLGTVLTALYAAGGLTERAGLRTVEVRRLGQVASRLDLYDYLLRGDTRGDIRLETGDVVFVPVHGTRVRVTGAVIRPGIYELHTGETLDDLITAAGGFRADAALRRVAVHRILPAGERGPGPAARSVVDVALATVPAEARGGSPPASDAPPRLLVPPLALLDGDSVVVDSLPPLAESYYVAIAGRVRKPGRYPWRPGMTLRDLVLLARGPGVGAYLKEAEIARLPEDRSRGQLATTLRVPLDSTYLLERGPDGRYVGPPGVPVPASGTPEVRLEPFDNVLIMQEPEFDFQRSVVVSGQVLYPGTYSLRSKEERLADVITRAGGLTSQAYPQGIRFVRGGNHVGRINIDLPRALRDRRSTHNVILQPGDSIHVPEYQPSVKVLGAVNAPGSVLWRRGADLDYYINAAGGLAATADSRRASVRYANGEVRSRSRTLIFSSDPSPGPGSEVFVPVKPASERTNWVALLGGVAQILASVVAIIVVTDSK